jgi:hypothetical protein
MKTFRWSWATGAAMLAMGISGCASDDVMIPEAELETPGAFIAIDGYDVENEFTLIRTIDRLDFQFETLLFFSTYDVKPGSWDEARKLAMRPDIPLRKEIDAQPRMAITGHPWQVVWFRTLTKDEQARVQ